MADFANFIHLRVHSAFSLLEGAMQPDEIAALCMTHRMPAVGVTDTNNLFGLMDLTEALVKSGVQPIIGCQFDIPLVTPTNGVATYGQYNYYANSGIALSDTVSAATCSPSTQPVP